jgi:site-specific recombinase XerD
VCPPGAVACAVVGHYVDHRLAQREDVGVTTARHRFDELAAAWLAGQGTASTRAAYAADLAAFRAWCEGEAHDPISVGPEEVERYRGRCEASGASPATVARRLSSLSSFFTHARRAGAVSASPVSSEHRPATPASPTQDLAGDEVDALLAASARLGPRTEVLVGLLLFDGLKLGEVLAADASDVRPERGGATIELAQRRRPVALRLDVRTADAVAAYLAGRTEGPLLLSRPVGRPPARLTRFGASHLLEQAGDEAGLGRKLTANALRRSFVARAHQAGRSLDALRRHLGHADVRTTRRHLRADGA